MSKIVKTKLISIAVAISFILSTVIIPAQAVTKKVLIGGEAFGLKLYCNGVMVTDFEDIESGGESLCPAEDAGLETNDVITSVQSKKVKTIEQLETAIKRSGGKKLSLSVIRNNKKIRKIITPVKNDKGSYSIGAWVKDSCAGIGTISFYNKDSKKYAALGHGIYDSDTGGLIDNSFGETLKANITSVSKSDNNDIGMLNGYFTSETIGSINKNTETGIYGTAEKVADTKESFEVAQAEDVTTGPAVIYTTVSDEKVRKYNVEIIKICNTYSDSNKNFVVKITDERLLKKTGGIVQGMSGSPIIRDGKLAGVLTHVFLEDCTCGYGIFAENMTSYC